MPTLHLRPEVQSSTNSSLGPPSNEGPREDDSGRRISINTPTGLNDLPVEILSDILARFTPHRRKDYSNIPISSDFRPDFIRFLRKAGPSRTSLTMKVL